MQEGIEIGFKEGEKRGMEKGRKDQAVEIANKAIREGLPIDTIVKLTGLSIEEIERL